MRTQDLVHACALHTDAAAVHEPDFPEPRGMCRLEIGIDHVRDVAWCERMEIELRADRDDVGRIHRCRGLPDKSGSYAW